MDDRLEHINPLNICSVIESASSSVLELHIRAREGAVFDQPSSLVRESVVIEAQRFYGDEAK